MDILKSIRDAFRMLPELAGSIGALVLYVIIIGMVAGVFVYQATTAGNISIDNTSSAMISAQTANFSAVVATIWTAATSVTGFIVIGVVVLIAIGILGKKFLSGGKL